ncbi:phytanoyl-CoA dioxygenase family protein [Alphaproteobacteria bacterium]|nr:phytanoyl-CoA dioxygenase family protein [Alphaproteobacteria bacterium]|tara:strand:+ start:402 stop:1250 length:849 start_codon:yes stop_codon:yes gene_type:complete
MKIKFLINKIKSYRSRNNLFYILGRFKLIRQLTKKFRALVNKEKIIIHSNNNYLTDQVDLSNTLEKLNKEGYCEGLKLNKDVLDKLLLLSSSSDYIDNNNRIFKSIKSIDEYNNKNNKPCCLLKLTNVELNKLANNISRDKYLLNLVNNYLGYINKIESKVQWSTVCNTTNDWREENGQTVTYHYDVHDLNFVYVFFYLTDCNVSSGAHQIIKGSHVKKNFFTHLVGSVKQTEKDLKQYFIEDKFITIEGQKGSGFIEDTSCFHRALPPLDKPRLTLQIRYS